MDARCYSLGTTLTKKENENLELFMKENDLNNKSDLLRHLMYRAGLIGSYNGELGLRCSHCNKVLRSETFAHDRKSGGVICKYCMSGL